MERPFLNQGTVDRIARLRERGFATRLQVQESADLVLSRDWEDDGVGVIIASQKVVVVRATTQPNRVRQSAVTFTGADGEFHKWEPFDVRRGDRFTLYPSGETGSITGVPYEKGGVVRAGFTLEG